MKCGFDVSESGWDESRVVSTHHLSVLLLLQRHVSSERVSSATGSAASTHH